MLQLDEKTPPTGTGNCSKPREFEKMRDELLKIRYY